MPRNAKHRNAATSVLPEAASIFAAKRRKDEFHENIGSYEGENRRIWYRLSKHQLTMGARTLDKRGGHAFDGGSCARATIHME